MKRIVIVDDSIDIGRLLQATLLTLDPHLSISVVPSAEEAMLEAGRSPLDLLVTDMRLPGINGLEMVNKVRAKYPQAKVIMVSGLADDDLEERAKKTGVLKFFHKPLPMQEFLETARELLGLDSAPAEPEKLPIPVVLAELRQHLSAQAVLLMDELGHVKVQAGDFIPRDYASQWVSAISDVLAASARLARLVDNTYVQQVQTYSGKELLLVIAPVGRLALMIALKPGKNQSQATILEEVQKVQQELGSRVEELHTHPLAEPVVSLPISIPVMAAQAEQPAPPPVHEDAESIMKFADFIKKSTGSLKRETVDAFWKEAGSNLVADGGNADMLSYEEASRLGLAPGEQKHP
jgi:DNA-binding response OmpR family regulator